MPLEPKAFYLRPLAAVPKDPTKPWFANVPVGVNTLKNIVSKIAESKPKLDPCNKKKSSDFPMFTGQMENCVFNFY